MRGCPSTNREDEDSEAIVCVHVVFAYVREKVKGILKQLTQQALLTTPLIINVTATRELAKSTD